MKVREQFEQWAMRSVGQPSFAGKFVVNGEWSYNHNIMDTMWMCWIAALATCEEQDASEAARRENERWHN